MHLRMTVQAALTQQVLRRHTGRQTVRIVGDARMPALRVTTLAKERGALHEHPRMVRSMWVVAGRAVFSDRRMFPQERTAFFRVAPEAGIVQVLPHKLQFRCGAVRAVTTRAGHFAFTQRMRIRFQRIASPECMTVIAFIGLRRCPQHSVIGSVTLMAAGTADLIVVMRASVPRESGIGFMTFKAHAVLRLNACRRVGSETNDRLSAATAADMQATRTVTGFTLQLTVTEGAARIRRHGVLCLKYGKDCLIAHMTGEAAISAAAAVGNIGVVR